MKKADLIYPSVNSEHYPKPITASIATPETMDPNTGIMLFTHGWGGNRFQHLDKMEYAVEQFNLIGVAVEFRQSGYNFDPVKGNGWDLPYDASFYQVFDVLNGLREVLTLHPEVDRGRLFHYGGSQGGHIALLGSIFAPDTFALVYATSALVELTPAIQGWAGRDFADYELSVRNVVEHATSIKAPLILEHGTDDLVVPCDHGRKLEARLEELKKAFTMHYYEGGGHQLEPTITRLDAFRQNGAKALGEVRSSRQDDFSQGRKIAIPCGRKTLMIDWSEQSGSVNLFKWIDNKS